jgi:AAA domain-containing protein
VTADVLREGGDVLYLDFEDDENGVVARLRALGVEVETIAAHLVYLRPDEALHDRRGNATPAAADFAEVVATRDYRLAVIDGVTEAMTTEGLELIDNADVARWIRMLPKRLAALRPLRRERAGTSDEVGAPVVVEAGCSVSWPGRRSIGVMDVVVELIEGVLQRCVVADTRPNLHQLVGRRLNEVPVRADVSQVWVGESTGRWEQHPQSEGSSAKQFTHQRLLLPRLVRLSSRS